MRACAIFVRSAFVFLVLLCAGLILQAQDPPKLPPDNSPPPDLSQAPFMPRVAVQRVRVPQGVPGLVAPLPKCPRGYHYVYRPREGDVCVKRRNMCVMIQPLVEKGGPGFHVFLCDAGAVAVTRIDPVYPADSVRSSEEGIAEFAISRAEIPRGDGKAKEWVSIQPSGPPVPWHLQAAAQAALKQWTWKQYYFEDHPARDWYTQVYFRFEITPDGQRVRTFLREPPKKSR
jgi:hypothetical protein